jgi:hypothetical protein
VEDRLASFQGGPFRCTANSCALDHVQLAMEWLHRRTNDRIKRGVEGTNKL